MDLSTIGKKLDKLEYSDIFEFNKDMNLVWSNTMKFNKPGSTVYKTAGYLARTWSKWFSTMRTDPAVAMLWGKKSRSSKPKKPTGIGDRKVNIRKGSKECNGFNFVPESHLEYFSSKMFADLE